MSVREKKRISYWQTRNTFVYGNKGPVVQKGPHIEPHIENKVPQRIMLLSHNNNDSMTADGCTVTSPMPVKGLN